MSDTKEKDYKRELEQQDLKLVTADEIEDFLDCSDKVTLSVWPEFMLHDTISNLNWKRLHEIFPEHQFALVDNTGREMIAGGNSIPVFWGNAPEDLPDRGWDWALETGIRQAVNDIQPNFLCALAIQIRQSHQGRGLSSHLVNIMKDMAREKHLKGLIAPVRPNRKADYPLISMEDYIKRTKHKETFDPWLRVHERLGGRILKICPQAMRIEGTTNDWENWTGMTFQSSGDYIIPGGLVPVKINKKGNKGLYIEPNVWIIHNL